MIDLEKIKTKVLKGKTVEEVLEKFNWKEFEEVIGEIFRNNEFTIKQNFRFKTKRRYEIDILAMKQNFCLCVDCKEWSRGRYKKAGLKQAVKQLEKRTAELKKFLKKSSIVDQKFKFYPIIVTLFEEDIAKESKSFIVPASKLNSFLCEFETYT